jgi:hypothetical protein
MKRIVFAALLVSASALAADVEPVGEWTHFTCPSPTGVSANAEVKFEFNLPQDWKPVLPPDQTAKWMATEMVSSNLALLGGNLRLTCTYATGGEMIARVERVIPQPELRFSECVKANTKRCALKGRHRDDQSQEFACLVDVKLHKPRPDTQKYLPFGALNCKNPSDDETGCHFKCRS